MKKTKKYKFSIEDKAHLHTLASFSLSRSAIALIAFVSVIIVFLIAGTLIMITPIHNLLPGYLKEDQRSATEENLLRLDSLRMAYDKNQAFIDNFINVTDIDRLPSDSAKININNQELSPDSLLLPSEAEQKFVEKMEERERFNISVLAPLAADGMSFSPISNLGIFTSDSKTSEIAKIIIPQEATIQALADGRVLSSYFSPADKCYSIVIQHDRGFASKYLGTGKPMTAAGEQIVAGQAIAATPSPDAKGRRIVKIMMWHNALPVIPYQYIGPQTSKTEAFDFDAPRGK